MVLNGFFVACEFAIVKVRASQLDALVEEGNAAREFREACSRSSRCLPFGDAARHHTGQSGARLDRRAVSGANARAVFRSCCTFIRTLLSRRFRSRSLLSASRFLHIVFGELGAEIHRHRQIRCRSPFAWFGRCVCFILLFRPAIWLLNKSSNLILRGNAADAAGWRHRIGPQ